MQANTVTKNPSRIHKVFIGGLPQESSEKDILNLLGNYANIVNINLKRRKDKSTEKCLGHGVAITKGESDVKKLLSIKQLKYQNRIITFAPFYSGEALKNYQTQFSKRRLFVKGFGKECLIKDLKHLFSVFGDIESSYFRREPGSDQKLAVIIYKNSKKAQEALSFFIEYHNRISKRVKDSKTQLLMECLAVRKILTDQNIERCQSFKNLSDLVVGFDFKNMSKRSNPKDKDLEKGGRQLSHPEDGVNKKKIGQTTYRQNRDYQRLNTAKRATEVVHSKKERNPKLKRITNMAAEDQRNTEGFGSQEDRANRSWPGYWSKESSNIAGKACFYSVPVRLVWPEQDHLIKPTSTQYAFEKAQAFHHWKNLRLRMEGRGKRNSVFRVSGQIGGRFYGGRNLPWRVVGGSHKFGRTNTMWFRYE